MADSVKVLVVDDEPHIRAFVTMLVQSVLNDCEVVQAADEAGAKTVFTTVRPSLVLLDINLIGGSGLNVLEHIRRIDGDTVVVMLTAINVRHTVEEALAKGANGYIVKDAGHEEMAETLREILQDSNEAATEAGNA